ncbi:glycogen debranching N-terminal domain-containing protein [Streptomyces sp. NPDC051940]|uniref:amylo-alpha-1,6-glucosidase n=1 Tax=Streptomyces sp. NPDC051940 TaxID=3155675 RepID=UPI00343B2774
MSVKTRDGIDEPEPEGTSAPGLQPFLHDACITLYAPAFTVSRPDGQLTGTGADGFYHGERRALARLEVAVDGVVLAPVGGGVQGADRAVFRSVPRGVAESTADPAVVLVRRRSMAPGRLTETLELTNSGRLPARFGLTVTAGTDLAAMEQVKGGRSGRLVVPVAEPDGLVWRRGAHEVRLTAAPSPARTDAGRGVLAYDVALPPGGSWRAELVCTAGDSADVPFPAPRPGTPAPWHRPAVRSADRALDRWLRQSHADLERLLLADPERPGELFLAAGAPWFATLFGRDSLWSARMLLPLGTSLAASTLGVLARRQGTAVDPLTQEEPGKILHEVRRPDATGLPPLYYGTVDATPLWVVLLHDAWRWGLDPARVEELLSHAEAALEWMARYGDADGDGFLEYLDRSGKGLANQGWKDSGDAIRFRDGSLAAAPLALCEVQAYAYEAAVGGAALLRAFGRPGADRWEEWAARLGDRFREAFWVEDDAGPYPAVALDGDKRPVDSVTSAFGQLLGTGLLNGEESALLAKRLAAPDLDSGFGLRTLSSHAAGYNPLGYHIGSVWPHDTAIAVYGLARAGFADTAAALAGGLVRAADAFDARLPELYAGYGARDGGRPVPYPAACRPQAWAAASSVLVLQSLLGLAADVPGGTVRVAPAASGEFRPLRAGGLRVAGGALDVAVAADGTVEVSAPEGIRVVTG